MTKKSINKLVKQDYMAVKKACKLQHENMKSNNNGKEVKLETVEDALITTFNPKVMKKLATMECIKAEVGENGWGQIKVEFVFSNDKCLKKIEKEMQMIESSMALALSDLKKGLKGKVGHA